jgi:hypothetical protein
MAQKSKSRKNCADGDGNRVSAANFDDGLGRGGEQSQRRICKPHRLRMIDPHQTDDVGSEGLVNILKYGSTCIPTSTGDCSLLDGWEDREAALMGAKDVAGRHIGRGMGKVCIVRITCIR